MRKMEEDADTREKKSKSQHASDLEKLQKKMDAKRQSDRQSDAEKAQKKEEREKEEKAEAQKKEAEQDAEIRQLRVLCFEKVSRRAVECFHLKV